MIKRNCVKKSQKFNKLNNTAFLTVSLIVNYYKLFLQLRYTYRNYSGKASE